MQASRGARLAVASLLATGVLLGASQSASSGAPNKLHICSLATGLKAGLHGSQGGGGTLFYWIIYVNSGSSACVLQGIPGAQPADGLNHVPVGPPSGVEHSTGRGGHVVLAAKGGTANTVYSMSPPFTPPVNCHQKPTSGVMLHFAGVRAFFVGLHLKGVEADVCTTRRTTMIDGVERGLSGGP